MTITLQKQDGLWLADMKDLPDLSPTGGGDSKHEAIADLFFKLIRPIQQSGINYLKFIDYNSFSIDVIRES